MVAAGAEVVLRVEEEVKAEVEVEVGGPSLGHRSGWCTQSL
jgi:hypothetical protein